MRLITLLAASLFATAAFAQDDFVFWPDADYDPAVPTVEQVTGHVSGQRVTWHVDVMRYFDALAAAHPDRVAVHRYAKTWEGRDLIYVVISSAENMARIDEIKSGMQKLRNVGNTSSAQAASIIQSQPAVTWLSYGVHGNEISSSDAAMLTAYHLLASRGDERIDDILENTVVILDPMQNPDGRDRFIHHFEMAEGLQPNSDRLSAEHNEPWPGGRTNHYLFDMNRDWFILSQPETRGRVDAIQEWWPVAFVDAHEMASDASYYFAPEAIPFNPHLAADQRASLELFGKTNAGWFDKFGIDYFTREVFDAFYPGYGASWPSYFGSIAMTASSSSVSDQGTSATSSCAVRVCFAVPSAVCVAAVFSVPGYQFTSPSWSGISNGDVGMSIRLNSDPTTVSRFTSRHSSFASAVGTSSAPAPLVTESIAARRRTPQSSIATPPPCARAARCRLRTMARSSASKPTYGPESTRLRGLPASRDLLCVSFAERTMPETAS